MRVPQKYLVWISRTNQHGKENGDDVYAVRYLVIFLLHK